MKTLVIMCRTLLAAAALAALGAAPALAVTNAGGASAERYVAAFTPAFGPMSVPYVGTMQLVIADGTIDGTYTGISARPDFLNNRIEPVIGSVNAKDGYVQFHVGDVLSFRGTIDSDGTISGNATYNGRLYDFVASPGSPGSR
jgi:hypothetical protein